MREGAYIYIYIYIYFEDQIVQEIENCTFLSIQIDEATYISTKEQLSIIIRLDSNGAIVERLLRFVDVSTDRTATSMSRVVKSILELHSDSINNKLIMQTVMTLVIKMLQI